MWFCSQYDKCLNFSITKSYSRLSKQSNAQDITAARQIEQTDGSKEFRWSLSVGATWEANCKCTVWLQTSRMFPSHSFFLHIHKLQLSTPIYCMSQDGLTVPFNNFLKYCSVVFWNPKKIPFATFVHIQSTTFYILGIIRYTKKHNYHRQLFVFVHTAAIRRGRRQCLTRSLHLWNTTYYTLFQNGGPVEERNKSAIM